MATLKFDDSHNMVTFLSKPTESEGFKEIVDFLNAHPIRYALTVNTTIYVSCIKHFWSSAMAKTINGEVYLHALVDGKRIVITETFVRRTLRLVDAEGIDYFSNSPIFENLALMGELTRIDTKIPQSSGPTKHVADEAVHNERGDSLVRTATTASSLEAEQDIGNITKTLSKATLNEPSSPGTSSGSGPRCNTLQSGEDSIKLKELMELCTNLQQRVLDLGKTKTTQAEEIVGATARVESSDDECLGEDASKQGRIDAINAADDITLVSVHDVNVSAGEEEVVEVINTAKLIINVAQVSVVGDKVSTTSVATTVSVATTTTTTTVDEITLAQALQELKSTKPKGKSQSHDKGKGIMIEEPVKKLSNKDQLKLDEEIALKLQVEIDEEERIVNAEEEKINEVIIAWDDIQAKVDADYQLAERLHAEEQEQFTIEEKTTLVNTFVDFTTGLVEGSSKRACTKLEQEITKKQKVDDVQEITKVDNNQETTKIKELMEIVPDEEEVVIDAIPLAVKSPSIVDWKIHTEWKKRYYQIIRADGKSQMYRVFSQMLKCFDKQNLEDLYNLVKAKYKSTRLVEDLDLVLWNDLKDAIYTDLHVGRKEVSPCTIYTLIEGRIVGIKSSLMLFGVTAALIDVNDAQSKIPLEGDKILQVHGERTQGVVKTLMNTNVEKRKRKTEVEIMESELCRVRAMSMTIQSSVMDKILATLSETSKVENTPAKCKANVVTDALSRKERVKPRRVRAMAMTIQYGVRGMILTAQSEAFKPPVLWVEIGDSSLTGLELVQETFDKADKVVSMKLGNGVVKVGQGVGFCAKDLGFAKASVSVIVSLLWIVDSEHDRLIVVDRGTRSVPFSHDDGSKPSSDDGKKVDEDSRKDSECNDQEKEDNVNSTKNVNATSTNEVIAVGGKTTLNFHLIQIYLLWKIIAYLTSQEMMKMMV
ncbi:hypothetical protein Tco_1184243 [Tanacetum coccineum]